MKTKILYKLEQIARLRLFAGMKDGAIADLLQMSQSGLSRILALPEYHEIERQLMDASVSKLDEAVAGKQDEIRELFKPAVPAAMRALVDAVTQRRDLRTAVAAAIHVLKIDPDRTFTEASKDNSASNGVNPMGVPAGVLASAISATSGVASAVTASMGVPKAPKDMN